MHLCRIQEWIFFKMPYPKLWTGIWEEMYFAKIIPCWEQFSPVWSTNSIDICSIWTFRPYTWNMKGLIKCFYNGNRSDSLGFVKVLIRGYLFKKQKKENHKNNCSWVSMHTSEAAKDQILIGKYTNLLFLLVSRVLLTLKKCFHMVM